MTFDPSQLDKVVAAITSQYGDGAVHVGGNAKPVKRIPTGSLELDYATTGGIPFGRFSRFWGSPSSGKTLVSWHTIANAQKMGLTCVYYNAEKQYDEVHAARLGVDVKKLIIVEGTIIEEIGTKMESLLGVANLHVVDSCTSCVALEELEAKVEEWRPGLSARVWGKVLRRVLERFDPDHNAGILVDQARSVIGYGGGEQAPGGKAMEHASSLTLHFRKGKWLYRTDDGFLTDADVKKKTISENKEQDGQEYVVRVEKSRVGRPGRVARFFYDVDTRQFDLTKEYLQAGLFFGVIQAKGAYYTMPDGTRLHGKSAVRSGLTDAIKKTIREEVMRQAVK